MPSVEVAAVVTSLRTEMLAPAIRRLEQVADRAGVRLVLPEAGVAAQSAADLAIVLGGDGTMLRALNQFHGSGVPVIGINYGRVGFLTAMTADGLKAGVERVLAGDYRTVELSTLEVVVGGVTSIAANDVVVAGAVLGRMVELGHAIGDEELGTQPCDGLICATPAGSTAYNLSNGGPVLVWGLDAMVLTFVAPHALDVRPLVVPRGADLVITNRTQGVDAVVLVDGREVGSLGFGSDAIVRVGSNPSLLATLPEVTFFRRYSAAFGH